MPALFAISLLLFGCTDGGGGESEESEKVVAPAVFMEDVCTSMSDWLASFLAGYNQVQALEPDASVAQSKRAFGRFLDDAVRSTDRLIGSIEDAGQPDVEGGDEFVSNLTSSLEQASAALEEASGQLDSLPDDPTRFREAAIDLGDTVREQLGVAGEAISKGVPEPIQKAQADTPACQSLGGGIGPPPQ